MTTHNAANEVYQSLISGELKEANLSYEMKLNIKTLITLALQSGDKEIQSWKCNSDCIYIRDSKCKGGINTDINADVICPYFKHS